MLIVGIFCTFVNCFAPLLERGENSRNNHKKLRKQMKDNVNTEELTEAVHETYRQLQNKLERKANEAEELKTQMRIMEATQKLLDEIERLNNDLEDYRSEVDGLREQLQDEKDKNQQLEMRLSEMSKLSAGMAKKSSLEELLEALRIFINKSKQKRIEKRTAVKEMVLELAYANNLTFPDDLAATLESLDDEPSESKVVNVAGNYNDIHDNGSVNN